jgi:putative transcriptional regulator
MSIIVNLDKIMLDRKISLTELAERVDITMANLSILKNNKARAVRFSTLDALCHELDCQPGDILSYRADEAEEPVD